MVFTNKFFAGVVAEIKKKKLYNKRFMQNKKIISLE